MARLRVLEKYLVQNKVAHLQIIPQITISFAEQLKNRLDKVVKNSAEGLVIRDPHVA